MTTTKAPPQDQMPELPRQLIALIALHAILSNIGAPADEAAQSFAVGAAFRVADEFLDQDGAGGE